MMGLLLTYSIELEEGSCYLDALSYTSDELKGYFFAYILFVCVRYSLHHEQIFVDILWMGLGRKQLDFFAVIWIRLLILDHS